MGRVSAKVPIRKLIATDDVYDRGFHKGNPGGLDAVDADLAPANIADGVTIFGKLGILVSGSLAEDTTGSAETAETAGFAGGFWDSVQVNEETTLATVTPTFDASSMAVAVGHAGCAAATGNKLKVGLYMDGVKVAESGYVPAGVDTNIVLIGTKAMSGATVCKLTVDNPGGNSSLYGGVKETGSPMHWVIGVGSIKLV